MLSIILFRARNKILNYLIEQNALLRGGPSQSTKTRKEQNYHPQPENPKESTNNETLLINTV